MFTAVLARVSHGVFGFGFPSNARDYQPSQGLIPGQVRALAKRVLARRHCTGMGIGSTIIGMITPIATQATGMLTVEIANAD